MILSAADHDDTDYRLAGLDTEEMEMVQPWSSSTLLHLQYWILKHPKIHQFQWVEGQTLGSTRLFLALTVAAYLTLTFILGRRRRLISLPPRLLKPFTAVHSLTLALLSVLMALGCSLSLASLPPRHALCFPPATPPSGPLFFWAYIFYLSKILEFLDTLFILLSDSARRRLTFLHVYHHATVVVMCYIWLETSQSLFPVALVTNATVHVLMYTYYLFCALGIRPRWKRLVTNCQILQFIFSFLVSILMLYYHFNAPGGCSGICGWCFNAIFNASLLILFLNFHSKSYASVTNKRIRMDKTI